MTSTNKLWEIYVSLEDYPEFDKLLTDNGFGDFTASVQRNGNAWIMCYPSEDIKMIASLRFNIRYPENKFGLDPGHNRLS